MKSSLPLMRAMLVLVTTLTAGRLFGTVENPPVGVAVKIWTRGIVFPQEGINGGTSISGTFLASSPGANDEYATASNSSNTAYEAIYALLGTQGYVRVEPSKTYTIDVSGWNYYESDVNIVAPPGYRVRMDGVVRSRVAFDSSATIVFEVEKVGTRHPGLAGMASDLSSSEIEWRVSLGALRNGSSAGDLALIDTGTRADWSPIFTPAMLYYEPGTDEVSVYRPNNIIRQIIANQVAVDIVTLSATSYEIRCYHPLQVEGSGVLRSFTGSPYITYRIEQGATNTTLKIVKEVRNVTSPTETVANAARTEYQYLKREDNWPAFKWTRTDWSTTSTPASAPGETYVAGGGTTSNRTENISVRVPGSTTAVASATRAYAVPLYNGVSVIGEVLASETVGSGTGIVSTFEYYTNASDFGSFGYLKSASLPGGNWVAYEYHGTDLANGYQGGRIRYRYKPFLDAPASVPATPSASQGEVTYHEYAIDVWGVWSRPSLVQTTINGTIVAKSVTTYNDNAGSANGLPLTESTRTDYSAAGQTLATVVRSYREDVESNFVRGQIHSMTNPDGLRKSYIYQLGSWNGSSFAPGSGIGSGTASRIAVITGGIFSGTSTVDGYTFDAVSLIDGKSTKDVTIRDSRALVVRTESHIWKSGAWQLVGHTNFSYDYAARLVTRVAGNGATYSATYDGGLKISETDEAGVVKNFTYDAASRVLTSTRTGFDVIGAVTTRMTYDAAGRVTHEEVGHGQSNPIVTQRQFDDAGRVTTLTPPGNYGIETYAYNLSNRTQTTTRADGSKIVTTDFLDGRVSSITDSGTVPAYHTYGVESDGRRWHQIQVGASNSPRWTKTWKDWLGREVRSEHPGFTSQPNVVSENVYAGTRLSATSKTGFGTTFFHYDLMGKFTRTWLDADLNGDVFDFASSDRISETDSYLESYNGAWWMRTDTRTFPKVGVGAAVTMSISRTRLTGHPANRISETASTDAEGNVTTQVVDVNRSARQSLTTTTRSGIPTSMTEFTVNGRSVAVTGFDGLVTLKGYDSFHRPGTVTDSRGNATTTTYIPGTTMVQSVSNAAGNTSVTSYDSMGRVSTQRDPKNFYTRYAYTSRGQVFRQWGDGAMPVEYGYDSYGDRVTMKTFRGGTGWEGASWPSSPGTADTTTWTYDGPSGLLAAKTDAENRTATQTYNVRGQTATRELARTIAVGPNAGQKVRTTYTYDNGTGELIGQAYNDGTPAVTYTYGRTGQLETVSDASGVRDLIYDANKPWRLAAEAHSPFYGGRVLTRLYDESGTIGRVSGFQLGAGAVSALDLQQTFGFTSVGRFETITSGRGNNGATNRTFRYGYLANSALIQSLSIDGSHPFTTTRTYESSRDLIINLESKWSTATRSGYAYTYDERGQRSKVVQSGDAFGDYGDVTSQQFTYNGRGELTGAIGYLGSDITQPNKQLPGRRHEYGYDTAGNREWSNRTGVPALRDNYTTNALNQYVSRENNTVPLSGTAEPDTGGAGGVSVTVQGGTLAPVAAGRQGRYWNDEITVNNNANPNSPNPWRGALTIFTAKRGTSGSPDVYRMDSRMAEIGARLQSFSYDLDGNLTSDGIVDYQWDAENRLVRMETTLMARSWGFPHRLLEFRYDYMGRRIQKRVIDVALNQEISCRRFLYDGWNLIAEYSAPNGSAFGTLLRSYTWGLDIVNTLSDAGGVGALLQIADHPSGNTYLPSYDGNGNIVSLTNAASGALAAVYEYSPYGEPLRARTNDTTIADNAFRFSTKWTDLETGLVYYGRRYYDPKNGRFINRDPVAETGGLNLYGFVGNNPVNRWDYLGMTEGCQRRRCRRPEDEGGACTLSSALTDVPEEGDPVPEPEEDLSYMGDYGPDEFDVFAPTLNDLEFEARVMEGAARQAAAQEGIDGIDAQFYGSTAIGNLESQTESMLAEGISAGVVASGTANDGMNSFATRINEKALVGFSSDNLPPLSTGSVSAGAAQVIAHNTSPVPASAIVNPTATSSTETGATIAPNSGPHGTDPSLYGGTYTVSSNRDGTDVAAGFIDRNGMMAPVYVNAGSVSVSSSSSTALSIIRGASVVNDVATIVGLGLLLVAPPVGATVLAATTVAGIGLGVTEGAMTRNGTMVATSLAAPFVGAGAGRIGLRIAGRSAATFNRNSGRYISSATGRFVPAASGAAALQVENVSDVIGGEVFGVIVPED